MALHGFGSERGYERTAFPGLANEEAPAAEVAVAVIDITANLEAPLLPEGLRHRRRPAENTRRDAADLKPVTADHDERLRKRRLNPDNTVVAALKPPEAPMAAIRASLADTLELYNQEQKTSHQEQLRQQQATAEIQRLKAALAQKENSLRTHPTTAFTTPKLLSHPPVPGSSSDEDKAGTSGSGGGGGGGSGAADSADSKHSATRTADEGTPDRTFESPGPGTPSSSHLQRTGSTRLRATRSTRDLLASSTSPDRASRSAAATAEAPEPPTPITLEVLLPELQQLLTHVAEETKNREVAEAAQVFISWLKMTVPASAAARGAMPAADLPRATTEATTPTYYARLTAVASACWNHKLSCKGFDPSVGEATVLGASLFYGIIYGIIAHNNAARALGTPYGAIPFSAASFLANTAQIFNTIKSLPQDVAKNFGQFRNHLAHLLEKCFGESETITNISTVLAAVLTLGLTGLSVFTAASLASATFSATASTSLAYIMWGFRSLLVVKNTLGLLTFLKNMYLRLQEKWMEVQNGDRSFTRATLETALIGVAIALAEEYSRAQFKKIGSYATENFEKIYSYFGGSADLSELQSTFSWLGVFPLGALNLAYVSWGAEALTRMLDRFHPLLLLAFIAAMPTGYPGIALITDVTTLEKVIAYIAAAISNDAALTILPYVAEKINKDSLIAHLEKFSLSIESIRLQYDEKLTAIPEAAGAADTPAIIQMKKLISHFHTIEHALGKARAELVTTPTTTLEKVAETLEACDARVRESCCFRVTQLFGRYACCSAKTPEEEREAARAAAAAAVGAAMV